MLRLWRRYQRWMDVRLLWPVCVREAGTRLEAEQAFRIHMELDPAYRDMDQWERTIFVKNLP